MAEEERERIIQANLAAGDYQKLEAARENVNRLTSNPLQERQSP